VHKRIQCGEDVLVGILSDIHGNHRALKAVLTEFAGADVDRIVCLGDIVGYFHQSMDCLNTVIDSGIDVIMGNHEGILLEIIESPPTHQNIYFLGGLRKNLSQRQKDWLLSLPMKLDIDFDKKRTSFFHGSPWNPLGEYIYPDSVDAERFAALEYDYIIMGHTHYPMMLKCSHVTLINPGSCGLPRDSSWKASAVLLDTETGDVKFVKATYDVKKTIEEAQAAGVANAVTDKLLRGYTHG
jgi:predicted phosphodiesterase